MKYKKHPVELQTNGGIWFGKNYFGRYDVKKLPLSNTKDFRHLSQARDFARKLFEVHPDIEITILYWYTKQKKRWVRSQVFTKRR